MKFRDGTRVGLGVLGFTEQDRVQVFDEAEGHGATWHLSSFRDFNLTVLQDHGIEHALVDLDGCLTPAYCHNELTNETIAALIAMKIGLKTLSLATNNEEDLTAIDRRFGFNNLFQAYQEGTMLPYKPSEPFYQHVLATLGAPPESVVMIGDTPFDDIQGAAQHGIRTMLVDRLDPYGFFG